MLLKPELLVLWRVATLTQIGIRWTEQPPELSLPVEEYQSPSNMWFLGLTRVTPSPHKLHLDRFSRFWSAHECDQQAHGQKLWACHCFVHRLIGGNGIYFIRRTCSTFWSLRQLCCTAPDGETACSQNPCTATQVVSTTRPC